METKHKRLRPCHRSQGAGLKLKMDFKLERSLVLCSKNHQQHKLKEERRKREALEEQLEAQKLINAELLQHCSQLQDELVCKISVIGVIEQKLQELEKEKTLLLTKLSNQEKATRELFDKLTEVKLKNLDTEEHPHQCAKDKVKVKHDRRFGELFQKAMGKKNQEHETAEKKSKEMIAFLEESIRNLTQKLCEEKNTSLMLEANLQEQKLKGKEAADTGASLEHTIEELMECVSELLLKLNEEKEKSQQFNEKQLQQESKLQKKEDYIRLLWRDMSNRETLFKDHLREVNEKMEKKSATCRQLRDQLQEEEEKSQALEALALKLMEELDKQMMEQLKEQVPETKRPHWKRVRSRLTPDFYRRWVKQSRSQEGRQPFDPRCWQMSVEEEEP